MSTKRWALSATLLLSSLYNVTLQAQPYTILEVATDLSHPWSVDFLPNGNYLVTERGGRLLRIDPDGNTTSIDGVPDTYFAGQGGFFDVLIGPTDTNGTQIYLSYAKGTPDANGTAIHSARLVGNSLADGSDILWSKTLKDTPPHYGGKMTFGPDQTLFITTGDGFDYRESSQDTRSELGKVLRINLDGSVPDSNPFQGELSDRIWSYGHRNPQGLAFDSSTGVLYLHEHGPKGGDEINIIERSQNYGWPLASYGVNYSGALVSPYTEYLGTKQPEHYWTPSIAPSGLMVYRGALFPQWQGSLFVGALVNRDVRRLDLSGQQTEEEVLFSELGERIRDVRQGPDGAIYLVTDGPSGRLLRVTPSE
jgi:aldose sugar dehydrogenase